MPGRAADRRGPGRRQPGERAGGPEAPRAPPPPSRRSPTTAGSASSPSPSTPTPWPTSIPAPRRPCSTPSTEARDAGLSGGGQRPGHGRVRAARRRRRAHRHRPGPRGARAHLRLARRRRHADPHRDLRRRARPDRRHRDDGVPRHQLLDADAGDDDRPRGRHRLLAVHPGPLPQRARAHRRPLRGHRPRRRHLRLRRRVRRPHRAHRARGARGGGHPVPHRHGSRRRGDRADRRPRGADPAARRARHAEVEGVRRPGAQVRARSARPTARSSTTACAGPAWSDAGRWPPSSSWSWRSARWPSRSRTSTSRSRPTAPPRATPPQRKASDLLADGFGPGREAPFQLVVDGRDLAPGERADAYAAVVALGRRSRTASPPRPTAPPWPGRRRPRRRPPRPARRPRRGARVRPRRPAHPGACSPSLRDGESGIEDATGTDIGITGLTAITTDVSDRLTGALPIYLAVVVGLAFLLLMVVFRSILVPLTATLGFLLSVLATLGVTVAVFQEGAFGLMEGQPIVSFMPIFVIGVVFGLAMDYQVFLVTRMREAHVHGASHPRGRRRRLPQLGARRRRRRGDHDRGVLRLRARGRRHHQVDGLRPRRRRGVRRLHRADGADPGADVPARREGLVAAGAGSTGCSPTSTSRARSSSGRTWTQPEREPVSVG